MSCKHSIKTVSKTYNYDCSTVVYLEIPIGISIRQRIVLLHSRNINEALQEETGSDLSLITLKTYPSTSLTYFKPQYLIVNLESLSLFRDPPRADN